MRLSRPKNITFFVAVAAIVLAILLHENVLNVGALDPHTFWIAALGGLVLAAGNLLRHL